MPIEKFLLFGFRILDRDRVADGVDEVYTVRVAVQTIENIA